MNDETQSSPTLIVPGLGGLYDGLNSIALPLLRLIVGLNLMPHGAQKLFSMFGGSAEGAMKFFMSLGFAGWMSSAVGILEVFGGFLLAIGFLTRPIAFLVFIQMAVVTFYVHMGNGFFWTKGGYEYAMLWMIAALVFAIRGSGGMSVDNAIGREF